MSTVCRRVREIELLWRLRFGEPPPLRTSPELTRRVLESVAESPPPRLCVEAQALEREAERACAELRATRERSRALMAEARLLAGALPA